MFYHVNYTAIDSTVRFYRRFLRPSITQRCALSERLPFFISISICFVIVVSLISLVHDGSVYKLSENWFWLKSWEKNLSWYHGLLPKHMHLVECRAYEMSRNSMKPVLCTRRFCVFTINKLERKDSRPTCSHGVVR